MKIKRNTQYSIRDTKDSRPTWDEYFLDIANLVSKRSTCLRRRVGAVLVKDKRILATGYNGAPSRITHCSVTGCLREKLKIPSGERHELCRGLHGEQNAFLQAALHGTSLKGASLYCTTQPCIICAKMIINAGIKEIVIKRGYPDKMAREFLREAKVRVRLAK
ncbi:MAG: cytidine deaminase [Omnitrophica bacterium RIFCSPLOWO2_02_FULL_45_16]|nr:MAG: cytidine deaminase [Omnitrophica bacterium RIFCSPHIGHO2_02_FULL_46_20]OGW93269.1 MAG: cytidine deaminase [Omnitrophica bacterium RIFCSPLOWO2_01_FULL_45_24]OGX01081.1 MAG: cytidine deaminase [Omnitrophica bacterium RIFCSPLOWO2_02_FULL_45_16]